MPTTLGHPNTASPTPCNFPGRVVTVFDRRLYVHEGIIGDLRWIENEWRKRGGHAAYPIRSDTGAYNCRKTTSGSRWSEHSRGWAVDINWNTNPFGRHLVTDMPKWFIDLWKARGFGWGGDWRSVKDAMHFSKAPREGGDGVLYRPAGIKETPPPPPEPEPEPQPEPEPEEDEEDDMAVNSNHVGPVGPGTYPLGIITAHNEVWQGYKLHSVLEVVGLDNDADAEILLVPHNSPLADADTVVSAKGAEANINTPKQHGVALLVVKAGLASGELREIFVPNK